jgi:uncharacterized membrane protein YccC
LSRGSDIWHKPALSVVVAMGVPILLLLAWDRLDLALYTAGGSMCALYAHGQPYAARARTLLWVVIAMVAGNGVALATAAATDSTAIRVAVAALLAAAHKTACDATRIGPPANVVFTFIAAASAFVPERFSDIPAHLDLTLAAGLLAWLVCMAPALVRPQGPQRIAVARALEAAARLAATPATDPGWAPARHAAAASADAAWHILLQVSVPTARAAADRYRLELLLARAQSGTADPRRLARWARALRRDIPTSDVLPDVMPTGAGAGEMAGFEQAAADARLHRRAAADTPHPLRRALRPGSPLLPVAARVAVGCALAGWASMAAGVGHPYWAVVTAAVVFQANMTLTWTRALHRVLGNLLGLAVFAALLPVARTGAIALVLIVLGLQFGAEATISRGYWLGTLCVTPMALFMTEFARRQPALQLLTDRAVDTVLGAALGLLCCVLVTNRRAVDRTEQTFRTAAAAQEAARRPVAQDAAPAAGPADLRELGRTRDRSAEALVELPGAADTASGEWWQRALPSNPSRCSGPAPTPTTAEAVPHAGPCLPAE